MLFGLRDRACYSAAMTAISSIPNLGPASEEAFAKAGITTAEEIRDMGAKAAYARLLQSGTKPHFIGYYVLVMGLQGRPWNDCKGEEKKALRAEFDEIKRSCFDSGLSEFEKMMDQIGLPAAKAAP